MSHSTAPNAYELSLDCVHCGLCLPSCPTYTLDFNEADSPRGRIYLMRALFENRIGVTDTLVHHLDQCLGCRGCETACPAGVQYGELLEQTRSQINKKKDRGFSDFLKKIALEEIFPYPKRIRQTSTALRLYQKSGLEGLFNALSLPKLLGRGIGEVARFMPRIPPKSERTGLAGSYPPYGDQRGRVALLSGCVMHELYGHVNRATIEVLQYNGFEVIVPPTQTCCGALHLHSGELAGAKELAQNNMAAFGAHGIDAILVNSAGCGSAMKEYPTLFGGDDAESQMATEFSSRVKDVSEFLTEVSLIAPWAPVPGKVAYDDACHLIHGQGIQAQPRSILDQIPELEQVPLCDSDKCCGGAGTYFVEQHDSSMRILEEKIQKIRESGADMVATGNPGCLLQLEIGTKKFGLSIPVHHPMELLHRSYREPEKYRSY